jgi:hypothetical protein
MEKKTIFIVLALLCAAEVLAEAYTWTDEDGIVHYSDRPYPGARIVDLGEFTASRPQPTTRPSPTSQSDTAEDAVDSNAAAYDSLEIVSPAAEETLWNIESRLEVRLALTPELKPGHQVRAYFDGAPQIVSGTNFQLDDVYRGVHNLQVEVIDPTGTLLIRSRPSRFYVQQNTVF